MASRTGPRPIAEQPDPFPGSAPPASAARRARPRSDPAAAAARTGLRAPARHRAAARRARGARHPAGRGRSATDALRLVQSPDSLPAELGCILGVLDVVKRYGATRLVMTNSRAFRPSLASRQLLPSTPRAWSTNASSRSPRHQSGGLYHFLSHTGERGADFRHHGFHLLAEVRGRSGAH